MIFGMVSLIHMVFNFIWNYTILYLYSFEIWSEHVSFCILDDDERDNVAHGHQLTGVKEKFQLYRNTYRIVPL